MAGKVPGCSFEKQPGVEVSLGPEMKSTGEVLGIGHTANEALIKGFAAAGFRVRPGGVLFSVTKEARKETLPIAQAFHDMGYQIYATPGTGKFLSIHGLVTTAVPKLSQAKDILTNLIKDGTLRLIVVTATHGREPERDGYKIRRAAVECGVNCLTSLDTANALVSSMTVKGNVPPIDLNEINFGHQN